ncbi:hypothetical protein EHEL_030420 [Encephalitozoon hellem ATCC 50504]|uniref:Cullin-associated NEDD8-dissociated protein 1 n=1 Tax=Encephalitozoon hellem TaxID=27973 RepID=A0A9Q9F7W4_ENCHE|nr:uncharacterized protein EHEL_030420 [Encephalitozoon hellem ATCC 50504]AFM97939.1 hypothetical protein EHEL_030420 [Encephalitozoon hellem ATCC 50504]UTX42743.1 cullin-associated NEDD8-dissociated protein 1 [Encephalitozoon hellem]|eukprot:XP_003886920.1 hypothetical protein EHEL_030420 [Encephalitozoon hellem ATCC 50504]
MYLHRSEIEAGVEKLMKTVEDNEASEKCRKLLKEIGKLEEENIRDFIREKRDVVDVFMRGLRARRQVQIFVIDFIYTFLVNDLLGLNDISEIINVISEGSWCEASKMKILQMSYYIIRYDNFQGDLALSLFKSIVKMIDDRSKQVQTTAKPIAMHLIDVAFGKASSVFKEEARSEESEVNSGMQAADTLEGCRPGTEKLLLRTNLEVGSPIDDGILFLRYLLQNIGASKEMGYFVIDTVVLITRKSELFEYEEFKKVYSAEVMDVLRELIGRRCSSKGNVYKVISRLAERHNCLFEKGIQRVFDEIEKSYDFFDDLEMEIFLDFFGSLDILVFNSYSEVVRRIFFRILEGTSLDKDAGSGDAISAIRISLRNQLEAEEKANGKHHPSTKAFFDKFCEILHAKLSGITNPHPNVEDLLETVLRFYAISGSKESLEVFMALGCRLGFTGVVCRNAIENRKHIQNSWDVVLGGCKDHLGSIIESIGTFDAEEIFFLIKAVEGLESTNAWSSKDKVDFLLSVFNITKPIVVEPLNVKIFEMILSGMLRESSSDEGYSIRIFCSVLVDYSGQLETLTPDVESVIFTLLQRMLERNLERNGLEILETMSEVLRIITPESSWDIVLQCVECSCIPCLYSSLYPIVRWIIEGSGHLISNEHFEKLIDCLHLMCLSTNSEISLKAMSIFQDVGECLMSRKAFNRFPGAGAEDREMNSAWAKYIKVLGGAAGDERCMVREAAIKYLVMFLEAESESLSPQELDFAAKSGLVPLLERGKQLLRAQEQESQCTLMLMLDECSRVIGKMDYHSELYSKFLEVVTDGVCHSGSSEIQSMCIESLRMIASKSSEVKHRDGPRQEGSDQSSEDMGFRMGAGERKSLMPSFKLRDLVFNAYKSMFGMIPGSEECSTNMYLEMIDLAKEFTFKSSEMRILIPLLRKFVHSENRVLQEKVLDMAEMWGSEADVQLEAYNDWMNFRDIQLSRMLIGRIGRVLSRNPEDSRYSEAVMELVEYCKEKAFWEDVARAFMKGSEGIRSRASFLSFISGSKMILDEAAKVGIPEDLREMEDGNGLAAEPVESTAKIVKKRERIVLEFLVFYHNLLTRFAHACSSLQTHTMQPFDQATISDVREGYKVIFEMSEVGSGLGKESICFKCYEILFHDVDLIYNDVRERIRKVLSEYNEMEMIYNGLYSRVKQREVYTILEKMWRSENRKLVNDVKDVLVESLRSKDYKVIDHVRKCLELILVQNK